MNTAEWRKLAMAAEAEQNWSMASLYWMRAIDAYPPCHANSALAIRDKAMMTDRIAECARAEAA